MILKNSVSAFIILFFTVVVPIKYVSAHKSGTIDRKALVSRHNIRWGWEERGQIPIGNGEFCFNVDGTGLQTFGGNTMSHWGWHSFPLPEGVRPDEVPETGSFINVKKGERYFGADTVPAGKEAIRNWMYDNPHIMNLGRLRFVRGDGSELTVEDITSNGSRNLDLWTGTHRSRFVVSGDWVTKGDWVNPSEAAGSGFQVTVTTYVNPDNDQVSVKVESDLIARGVIKVALDFPYPTLNNEIDWVGDFKRNENNLTTLTQTSNILPIT